MMMHSEDITRPPIVAILGHVDHGKSTLLDNILKTNIVEQEAGNITQNISAYEVIHTSDGNEKKITFLDTPGHQAFQHMRSNGAELADVAILVVSAEDGVKQQTKEALIAIKEGKIPYVVAINKIDKPNADIEKTKRTLLENGVYLEGLGGDVPYMCVSAKQGENVGQLLDLVVLASEIEEYKSNRERNGKGFIIESHINKGTGITSNLLIKDGTLKKGDYIVSGKCYAKIKSMQDYSGKDIKEASFSSPVIIGGFNDIPLPGSQFKSFKNLKEAQQEAQKAKEQKDTISGSGVSEIENVKPVKVSVVLKAGSIGLLDALIKEIEKIENEKAHIHIVQKGVGNINASDVERVEKDSHPLIVGFQTSIDDLAVAVFSTTKNKIPYKSLDIIYKLTEWVEEEVNKYVTNAVGLSTGEADIIAHFSSHKGTHLVGIRIKEGNIATKQKVRIIRDGEIVEEGVILSMQQKKKNIDKIENKGSEVGIQLKSKNEVLKGDVLEAFISQR